MFEQPISKPVAARGIRAALRRGIAALLLAAACLTSLLVATSAGASALPCSPRYCPDPPPPPPPSPTYTVDTKPLALLPGQTQPVSKYGAEHVATTVHVRYQIQRSTGTVLSAWVVSDYHVWNDYALQGWHVTVHENLYNAGDPQQQVWSTNQQTIGVTGTFWDSSSADVYVEESTPVPVSTAQNLYEFQAVDTFSN